MANVTRIKRRVSGLPGAPGVLENAELAYNEVDDTLYIGKGTGGAGGTATVIEVVGGKGAVVLKSGDQSIDGVKTFTSSPVIPTPMIGDNSTKAATTAFVSAAMAAVGAGDMLKSVYDSNNDGKVDLAAAADTVPWTGIANQPSVFPTDLANVAGLIAALAAKAPLASPEFTGAPVAPTAAAGTNNTVLATTAFVVGEIAALTASAPGVLDTLDEIATALNNDPNFATTMTAALAGKAAKDQNLSDLTNVATARTNLGLGTLALQNAAAVAITGGTIDGIVLDGGTF